MQIPDYIPADSGPFLQIPQIPVHSCRFRWNSSPFLRIPPEFRSIPVDSAGILEFRRIPVPFHWIPPDSSAIPLEQMHSTWNGWGTVKYCLGRPTMATDVRLGIQKLLIFRVQQGCPTEP